MKHQLPLLLCAAAVWLLTSCAESITRGKQYAALYEEAPVSVVIMPPINETNSVEAKDYFYTTLYAPLCEKGYYVFSPYLTMEMFQTESAYDSEPFLEADLSTFRNVLGADAAMFTIIKSWKRNNLGGKLTVDVEYRLRSTKTGETLYRREGLIKVDTRVGSGSGGIGALIGLVATAVNTALTDKVVAGRKCTAYVLSDLPTGKYSPTHGKDQDEPAGKAYIKATVK